MQANHISYIDDEQLKIIGHILRLIGRAPEVVLSRSAIERSYPNAAMPHYTQSGLQFKDFMLILSHCQSLGYLEVSVAPDMVLTPFTNWDSIEVVTLKEGLHLSLLRQYFDEYIALFKQDKVISHRYNILRHEKQMLVFSEILRNKEADFGKHFLLNQLDFTYTPSLLFHHMITILEQDGILRIIQTGAEGYLVTMLQEDIATISTESEPPFSFENNILRHYGKPIRLTKSLARKLIATLFSGKKELLTYWDEADILEDRNYSLEQITRAMQTRRVYHAHNRANSLIGNQVEIFDLIEKDPIYPRYRLNPTYFTTQ